MLQITHAAAELLSEIRREQDVPDDHGLRVFAETSNADEVSIGLGFTEAPAAGDQITEQEGLMVFVAPEVATPLTDTAIDVTPASNGATRLVFRPQSETEPAPS